MRALVYLIHADPSVGPKYTAAAAAQGIDLDLLFVNNFAAGGLSSAYVALAAQLIRAGRYLPTMRAKYPAPRQLDGYAVTLLASYSAGYGLARPLLSVEADVAELTGYVAIDSYHDTLARGPLGLHADPHGLAPLIALAAQAKNGTKVLYYGHTDVPTPQAGPGAYASTTQVAAQLLESTGGEGGGFHVDAFNLDRDPRQEHMHALTAWGPAYLARALGEAFVTVGAAEPVTGTPGSDDDVPATPRAPGRTAGAQALALAQQEVGTTEVPPGSNDGPRIREYGTGCERNGRPLRVEQVPWCAKFASWCGRGSPAHRWRMAVAELVTDAKASGHWRALGYTPAPGDLAVFKRQGHDPRLGQEGHVGRVETVTADRVISIDGNHNDRVERVERALNDPDLVGWIAY